MAGFSINRFRWCRKKCIHTSSKRKLCYHNKVDFTQTENGEHYHFRLLQLQLLQQLLKMPTMGVGTLMNTFVKVSSPIAVHAVSIYFRSAASVAGFLRYTTFLTFQNHSRGRGVCWCARSFRSALVNIAYDSRSLKFVTNSCNCWSRRWFCSVQTMIQAPFWCCWLICRTATLAWHYHLFI